jgi:hypothetical protein
VAKSGQSRSVDCAEATPAKGSVATAATATEARKVRIFNWATSM